MEATEYINIYQKLLEDDQNFFEGDLIFYTYDTTIDIMKGFAAMKCEEMRDNITEKIGATLYLAKLVPYSAVIAEAIRSAKLPEDLNV